MPRAVLVAIAIPIFTKQLEKSREATDLANVRAAYAEVMTAAVDSSAPETGSIVSRSGSDGSYVYTATVTLKQQVEGWQTDGAATAVAGVTATGTPTASGSGTITYTQSSDTTEIAYQ